MALAMEMECQIILTHTVTVYFQVGLTFRPVSLPCPKKPLVCLQVTHTSLVPQSLYFFSVFLFDPSKRFFHVSFLRGFQKAPPRGFPKQKPLEGELSQEAREEVIQFLTVPWRSPGFCEVFG